jgi:hypothetical protein
LRGCDAWDAMIWRQAADQRTQRMVRNKTLIVPVCIDATPESGADMPESFVRGQWAQLPGGATPDPSPR